MKISIIIPTYNEEGSIVALLNYLRQHLAGREYDLIVSDGGSEDSTVEKARAAGAMAQVSPQKGRAAQMNYGASLASGEVLYFIHADCFPPSSFFADIEKALEKGYDLGRYRTRFDSDRTILKVNAWFTRFDLFICMGGDQTLFIRRALFEKLGGFCSNMRIMEEYEFCQRARQQGRYVILPGAALISARKYEQNSWLRVQLANARVVRMYKRGASQDEMTAAYRSMLNYRHNAAER
jgi:rSAM/selenodomain-associated transferase 2